MLSHTSQYALRALYYIASHGAKSRVFASDIAREMDIPQRYLSAILSLLVQRDILQSTRGRKGGFQLARPAGDITLAEIVDPFQDLGTQTNCPFGNPDCGHCNPCPVHTRWTEVVSTYRKFVEATTLGMLRDADLALYDI